LKTSFLKTSWKSKAFKVIPVVFVAGVLIASLMLPSPKLGPYQLLTYGYGYGTGGGFLAPPLQYHPLTPARILDTRNGGTPLAAGETRNVLVATQGGVPSGATAAVINVTATNGTAAGYLTIFPTGATQPVASNLNWTAKQNVPNLVEIALGTGGMVSVYNAQGSTDVIFDVQGYVSVPVGTPGGDGLFNALVPARVLDTRDGTGTGGTVAKVGAGSTIDLTVTGAGGVPSTGVEAVVLNVTATNPTAAGYVTAWPKGATQPVASNLNFAAGQTVPNRVIVKVGTGGKVSLYNPAGTVDLVADVNGWFTDGTSNTASGDVFTGTTPSRIMDTRLGGAPAGPASTIHMNVVGQGGVPAGAHSAVLNVTVTNPAGGNPSSYLTLWPTGSTQPLASDVNFHNGLTIANLTLVKIGANGQVDVYNAAGTTQIVVDVVGWYS
jgi:hypothetical protein